MAQIAVRDCEVLLRMHEDQTLTPPLLEICSSTRTNYLIHQDKLSRITKMPHVKTLMKQNLLVYLVKPIVISGDLRKCLNHHEWSKTQKHHHSVLSSVIRKAFHTPHTTTIIKSMLVATHYRGWTSVKF